MQSSFNREKIPKRKLNNENILEKKPNLKLKPNHYRPDKVVRRIWLSKLQGQAFKDGNGWYSTRRNPNA